MKEFKLHFSLWLFFLAVIMVTPSCNEEMPDPAKGEALVYQLWDAIRNQDLEGIKANMAPGFQSVHDFGSYNMAEELELLHGLSVTEFEISDLKITTDGEHLFIATYFVAVSETIEGERLSHEPAPRMTIFVEDDGIWRWAAHANLKPVKREASHAETGESEIVK